MKSEQPAFPVTFPNPIYNETGLTKLEYFSIECFKVVAMQPDKLSVADKVTLSIHAAKELLRQLENEN